MRLQYVRPIAIGVRDLQDIAQNRESFRTERLRWVSDCLLRKLREQRWQTDHHSLNDCLALREYIRGLGNAIASTDVVVQRFDVRVARRAQYNGGSLRCCDCHGTLLSVNGLCGEECLTP